MYNYIVAKKKYKNLKNLKNYINDDELNKDKYYKLHREIFELKKQIKDQDEKLKDMKTNIECNNTNKKIVILCDEIADSSINILVSNQPDSKRCELIIHPGCYYY